MWFWKKEFWQRKKITAKIITLKAEPKTKLEQQKPEYQPHERHITSLIGRETLFHGNLVGNAMIRVDGDFVGNIYGLNQIYISKSARVKANIYAHQISINGLVHGDIHASGMVELLPNSVFIGSVHTPSLKVKAGAQWLGKSAVSKDLAKPPSVAQCDRTKKTILLKDPLKSL